MVNNPHKNKTSKVEEFYNDYWPKNVPDYRKTIEHIHSLIPNKHYNNALDGGCGTGVCSVALSMKAENITGVDISEGSLNTAKELADKLGINNIEFKKADLLKLPFEDQTFDLILSWGVIHHTVDPLRALDELNRSLKPNGVIVLAIYLKTKLTFMHEAFRKTCLKSPKFLRKPFIKSVTWFVLFMQLLGKTNQTRDDNILIESQVEDWFFVPEKHFYSIEEMKNEFSNRGLVPEILVEQTARFKSSSCFIIRGIKK